LFVFSGQQGNMQTARKQMDRSQEARGLVTELEAAHTALSSELAAMQSLQDGPQPQPDRWAQARWKLSRASRQRRGCVDKAYILIMAEGTAAEILRVRQLQAQDGPMLAASHAHVGHWTPDRIEADWSGYCEASRAIRRGMADRVRSERELLLPILARLAAA
jgi:hypothetical protein